MTSRCPIPDCRTPGVHYHRTEDGVSTAHGCRCQDLASSAHVDGIVYGAIAASPCYAPRTDVPMLCTRGHDKDVVGIDSHGRCRECKRSQRLAS